MEIHPSPFPHHYMLCDPGIYSIQVAAGGQLLESCGGGVLPEETYSMTITMSLFDRCANQVLKRLKDLPNVPKVWCCHWKPEPMDTPQRCPPPYHTALSFWCWLIQNNTRLTSLIQCCPKALSAIKEVLSNYNVQCISRLPHVAMDHVNCVHEMEELNF